MTTCTGIAFIIVQLTCTDAQPAVPVARFCEVSSPLRWSKNDTQDTIVQAKRHNARGVKLCGWR